MCIRDSFFWVFAGLMVVVMIHDTKRMVFDPIPAAARPVGAALEAAS